MSSVLSPSPRTPATRALSNARDASPSYFGLSVDSSSANVSSSGGRNTKGNFSPSASGIRSNAASPSQTLPFHTNNSEYDAFRREVERKRSESTQGGPASHPKDRPSNTKHRDTAPSSRRVPSIHEPLSPRSKPANPVRQKLDGGKEEHEASSRSPKRLLSDEALVFPNQIRRESPAPFTNAKASRTGSPPPPKRDALLLPHLPGQHSISHEDISLHPAHLHQRADTLPEKLELESPSMATPQRVVTLLDCHVEEILLLDLRVITQYSRSRIRGALNLCVPTTLLKRPSYNIAKLADTFKDEEDRAKFSKWKHCQYIIVYDASCSQMKEAASCLNILKKFEAEGWEGESCIIKGGFTDFSRKFPLFVEQSSGTSRVMSVPSLTLNTHDLSSVAAVIGGCPMPAAKSAANPFFGNIRQNMDLIGGVGQLPVKLPPNVTKEQCNRLPGWLKRACDQRDNGRLVADKFFHIEKREQRRMQDALSGNVTYGAPAGDVPAAAKVQIAGIEKGAKNRYNNIWPFEHSRVRLEGCAKHECDYINANYVQTSLSDKRYIATQGPIPATFEDFWRIVWQQDVRVIVMLTAEKEGGQIKAHNYWEAKSYGSVKLRFLSEHRASLEPGKIKQHKARPESHRKRSSYSGSSSSAASPVQQRKPRDSYVQSPTGETSSPSSDAPNVIVRKFTLADTTQPFERMREITQLHYSSWPDFGAPAHPAHLLGLVEQCDAVVNASSSGLSGSPRPVLVHCSAGCGRTGTFCTVDSILDAMRAQRRNMATSPAPSKRSSKLPSPMDIDRIRDSPFFSNPKAPRQEYEWTQGDDTDLIEKAVEEFRLKRISMVQSLRQFVLCYETVLEWLIAQDTEAGRD